MTIPQLMSLIVQMGREWELAAYQGEGSADGNVQTWTIKWRWRKEAKG